MLKRSFIFVTFSIAATLFSNPAESFEIQKELDYAMSSSADTKMAYQQEIPIERRFEWIKNELKIQCKIASEKLSKKQKDFIDEFDKTYRKKQKRSLTSEDVSLVIYDEMPILHNKIKSIAKKLQIKTPITFILNSTIPNALAFSIEDKNTSIVLISKGLISLLDDNSIEGIIGHELGHIVKQHGLKALFLRIFLLIIRGGIGIYNLKSIFKKKSLSAAFWQVVKTIATDQLGIRLIQNLIERQISQQFEYEADTIGASINKDGIIKGLKKLSKLLDEQKNKGPKNMFIRNLLQLFETHPEIEKRIRTITSSKK